jgi:hypothetical protein
VLHLPAGLYCPGDGIEGAVWLAARLPRKREGYRTPGASKDARGKRGRTHRHGLIQKRAPRSRRARIGRSRSCSRVVQCCRSRQTVSGAEKRTLSISPDLDSVQGRAPSSQLHVRKYAAAGEETVAPSSRRKPSRDRFREWVRTRAWRGALAMEDIPDRRGRRLFTERLHVAVSAHSADLEPRASEGESHGRATGMSEVRWLRERAEEDAAQKPGAARRSGSGVLNRQVPQPPSSRVQALGEGARRKPRRDAGNECGASARSGRSSGKQKSVECIGLVLRVLSQGRPQEGESARRKLPSPLTRRADAHLQTGWAARGGGAACCNAHGNRRRGAG